MANGIRITSVFYSTNLSGAFTYAENIYIDMDGTLHPHAFTRKGLWVFDGQIYYLAKPPKNVG
jgi:hypothetical protein